MNDDIIFFWSHKGKGVDRNCLSQWYVAPFTSKEHVYFTAEHWMMAEKSRLFHDDATLERILNSEDPAEAKALGRNIAGFNEHVWDQHKLQIVVRGNFMKFTQNEELGDYLYTTRNSMLVEASPYDKIWGIGLDPGKARKTPIEQWPGKNLLGIAIMIARDIILTT